jgi:hypothetical protein
MGDVCAPPAADDDDDDVDIDDDEEPVRRCAGFLREKEAVGWSTKTRRPSSSKMST